jgi:multidrug efflux pump subunit AcrB
MDLAFIQTNEKLDRITNLLPKDVQRPQIIRTNTSDIPIINIQVIPKDGVDYFQVSTLVEKNLRKRIEQIDGVSLIDINGLRDIVVSIIPSKSKLVALGISENNLISAINSANLDIGGLNIKDGNYSFFVKLSNRLESINSITNLPILNKNGKIVILNEVAEVKMAPKEIMGYHLYNGKEGLVITVQKQTNSRMNDLVPKIKNIVKQFQIDYPQVDFYTSQDQTYLLDAGINNLQQDLIYGGLLTVIILFLFLGNLASPILMSISIPVSLIITFSHCFKHLYISHYTINIFDTLLVSLYV